MTTLVYLERFRCCIYSDAKGKNYTFYRVFLAALVTAAKYLNDRSPKNKDWATYTEAKGQEEFWISLTTVNLIEREFLVLLKFNLRVTAEELYLLLHPQPPASRAATQQDLGLQQEHIAPLGCHHTQS
jgi:PHO85 cyclin-1